MRRRQTDSDVVVGGETSSESELSSNGASEVGETTGSGVVAVAPSMAYELQSLMDDGSGAESTGSSEQPRWGRGRRPSSFARQQRARARPTG